MRWYETKRLGRRTLLGVAAMVAMCGGAMSQPPPDEPAPKEPPRPTERRREDPPPRPREDGRPRDEGDRFRGPDLEPRDPRRYEDGREGGPDFGPRPGNRGPAGGPQNFDEPRYRELPMEGRARYRPVGPPREEMERMRRDDPEMFALMEQDLQLERECSNIAGQIRKEPNKEASSEARKKLADLVKTHFDVRQKQRQLRLNRLEDELKKVKEAVEARQAQAEQIIKRRLNELTGEAEDIGF